MRQRAITGRVRRAVAATGAVLVVGGAAAFPARAAWAGSGARAGGGGVGAGGGSGGGGAAAAQARRDLLGRASFPAGWTSSPNPVAGDTELVDPHRLARCTGAVPGRIPAHPPSATGPELDLAAGGLSVNEQVQVYPTTAAATAAVGVIAAPGAPACATTALDRSGASKGGGESEGRYSVTRLALPGEDAQAAALAVTVALEEHGRAATTTTDNVVVRSGRTVATVTLTALGEPFPPSLEQHLVAEAAARIA